MNKSVSLLLLHLLILANFGHGMDRQAKNGDESAKKSKMTFSAQSSNQAQSVGPAQAQQPHQLVLLNNGQTRHTMPTLQPNQTPNLMGFGQQSLNSSQKFVGVLPSLSPICNSKTQITDQPNERGGNQLKISELFGQKPNQLQIGDQNLIKSKMAMPTYFEDEKEKIFFKLKEMQQKINAIFESQFIVGESQFANQNQAILKEHLLERIWKVFAITFAIVGLKANSIGELKVAIGQKQLPRAIHNSRPELTLVRIETYLAKSEYLEKNALKVNVMEKEEEIFEQINAEAIHLFGQTIFDSKGTNDQKTDDGQAMTGPMEKLKVFFFYIRLYRKLLGYLETPFSGKLPENIGKSARKAIILSIGMAKKQIDNEFETIVKTMDISAADGEKKINAMLKLEEIQQSNEKQRLALFTVQQTLAPLLRRDKIELAELFQVMENVQAKNIVCEMITKEAICIKQMAHSSAKVPNSVGVISNFLHALADALKENAKEFGQNREFVAARVAYVFLALYKAVDEKAPMPNSSADNWGKLAKFIAESVKQLDAFIGQLKRVKKEMIFNGEKSEKGFISDYLLENCIHYV